MAKASFNWIDPLLLDQQLTEEELSLIHISLPLIDLPAQQWRHSHHLGHGAAQCFPMAARHTQGLRFVGQLHALFLW